METLTQAPVIFRFHSFEVNSRAGEIRKHGIRIRLQEQPFQVLSVLLQTPGELVTRDELRRRVWLEDTFVDFDHALNTAVKKIRAALNDDADAPRYVETAPRRGYRFIAPVTVSAASTPSPAKPVEAAAAPATKYWFTELLSARIAAVVVLTAMAILFTGFRLSGLHRRPPTMTTPGSAPVGDSERVMVAVLPFQNISQDASQDYFSDGMTEETISQMGRLNPEHLGVIARTSAMKYKNASKSVDEIGKELHVDYVVEGSVRRDGPRVRIVAQLIRTSDQSPRWTQNFDRNLKDVISLETEVASAIASDIEKALGNSAPLLQPVATRSMVPEAYDSYLRGITTPGMRSHAELDRVVGTFESGLKMDPHCAMNYAGLAYAYDLAGNSEIIPPSDAFPKVQAAALEAIKLDPNHPDAHLYLADALLTKDLDWAGADREIRRALALNPNDAKAHDWYGLLLFLRGETDAGFSEMYRALTLDPLSTERMVFIGSSAMVSGRLGEAKKYLKMAIEIDPDLTMAHTYLSYLYDLQGQKDLAIEEMGAAFRLMGEPDTEALLKRTYAISGYEAARKAAVLQDIAYAKNLEKQRYVSAMRIARDYAVLGDKPQTIAWLERAYEERDVRLLCLRAEKDIWYASVKNEPGFEAIVKNIGYPH